MARDFSASSFSGANRFSEQEDADPRVGLVNLADVMLVFACGLMLALVVNWNIDLPDMTELDSSQMEEVSDVEETQDLVESASSSYMELGTVYQDPNTGKLYMMTQGDALEEFDASSVNETPQEDAAGAYDGGSDEASFAGKGAAGDSAAHAASGEGGE